MSADPRHARLLGLATQLARCRADQAALLRAVADALDPPADAASTAEADPLAAEIERMAAGLRAAGHALVPGGWIRSAGAAAALAVAEGTLRDWRSAGTGPRWRRPGGVVLYSLRELIEWRDGRP